MNLKNIKLIHDDFNQSIFKPLGFELSPAYHRRTRSLDTWAYWNDALHCYFWNRELENCPCIQSLIFHEALHQWQKEYMNDSSESIHDRYFFGWHHIAFKKGLTLQRTY